MPIYEYQCTECGTKQDVLTRLSERKEIVDCRVCQSYTARLDEVSAEATVGLQFTGPAFSASTARRGE